MVFDLLSFFVGFLLLLLLLLVLINYKKGQKLNLLFLVIIAVAGLQRFLHGLEVFGLLGTLPNPLAGNLIFPFFKFVAFFLFFDNLLSSSTSLKKVILHLLFPLLVLGVSSVTNLSSTIIDVLFLVFSTVYWSLSVVLIWKKLINRKNVKEIIYFQAIKLSAIFLLGILTFSYFLANYLFFSNSEETFEYMFRTFNSVSSVLWFFVILFIFKNPLFLYGEQLLLEKINGFKKIEVAIWRSSKVESTAKEDLEVEKKVKGRVEEIIYAINTNEEALFENFASLPTLKEFAFKLNCPQSHIKYVFNYYSYGSYGDYQTILKVKYALKLIKSAYLDTHTIDSLSSTCLFTHRSTFYKKFKKLTGYTPTEYQSALKN